MLSKTERKYVVAWLACAASGFKGLEVYGEGNYGKGNEKRTALSFSHCHYHNFSRHKPPSSQNRRLRRLWHGLLATRNCQFHNLATVITQTREATYHYYGACETLKALHRYAQNLILIISMLPNSLPTFKYFNCYITSIGNFIRKFLDVSRKA